MLSCVEVLAMLLLIPLAYVLVQSGAVVLLLTARSALFSVLYVQLYELCLVLNVSSGTLMDVTMTALSPSQ
jgi:hypothetical protein